MSIIKLIINLPKEPFTRNLFYRINQDPMTQVRGFK